MFFFSKKRNFEKVFSKKLILKKKIFVNKRNSKKNIFPKKKVFKKNYFRISEIKRLIFSEKKRI